MTFLKLENYIHGDDVTLNFLSRVSGNENLHSKTLRTETDR